MSRILSCALILIGSASLVRAAEYPKMTGRWEGSFSAVVLGSERHHVQPPNRGKISVVDNMKGSFVIEGQEGARFWGQFVTANYQSPVLGMFRKDGKSFVATNEVGAHLDATLQDDGSMEICYTHGTGKSLVASCSDYHKVE